MHHFFPQFFMSIDPLCMNPPPTRKYAIFTVNEPIYETTPALTPADKRLSKLVEMGILSKNFHGDYELNDSYASFGSVSIYASDRRFVNLTEEIRRIVDEPNYVLGTFGETIPFSIREIVNYLSESPIHSLKVQWFGSSLFLQLKEIFPILFKKLFHTVQDEDLNDFFHNNTLYNQFFKIPHDRDIRIITKAATIDPPLKIANLIENYVTEKMYVGSEELSRGRRIVPAHIIVGKKIQLEVFRLNPINCLPIEFICVDNTERNWERAETYISRHKSWNICFTEFLRNPYGSDCQYTIFCGKQSESFLSEALIGLVTGVTFFPVPDFYSWREKIGFGLRTTQRNFEREAIINIFQNVEFILRGYRFLISNEEERNAGYAYMLTRMAISKLELTHDERAIFILNACVSFYRYGQTIPELNDSAYNEIWIKFRTNHIQISSCSKPIQIICQMMVNKQIPFSVIVSLMVVLTYFYDQEALSHDNGEPTFCLSQPLPINLPTKLKEALLILDSHFQRSNDDSPFWDFVNTWIPPTNGLPISPPLNPYLSTIGVSKDEVIDWIHTQHNSKSPFMKWIRFELSLLFCPEDTSRLFRDSLYDLIAGIINKERLFKSFKYLRKTQTLPIGFKEILRKIEKLAVVTVKNYAEILLENKQMGWELIGPFLNKVDRGEIDFSEFVNLPISELTSWITVLTNTRKLPLIKYAIRFFAELPDNNERSKVFRTIFPTLVSANLIQAIKFFVPLVKWKRLSKEIQFQTLLYLYDSHFKEKIQLSPEQSEQLLDIFFKLLQDPDSIKINNTYTLSILKQLTLLISEEKAYLFFNHPFTVNPKLQIEFNQLIESHWMDRVKKMDSTNQFAFFSTLVKEIEKGSFFTSRLNSSSWLKIFSGLSLKIIQAKNTDLFLELLRLNLIKPHSLKAESSNDGEAFIKALVDFSLSSVSSRDLALCEQVVNTLKIIKSNFKFGNRFSNFLVSFLELTIEIKDPEEALNTIIDVQSLQSDVAQQIALVFLTKINLLHPLAPTFPRAKFELFLSSCLPKNQKSPDTIEELFVYLNNINMVQDPSRGNKLWDFFEYISLDRSLDDYRIDKLEFDLIKKTALICRSKLNIWINRLDTFVNQIIIHNDADTLKALLKFQKTQNISLKDPEKILKFTFSHQHLLKNQLVDSLSQIDPIDWISKNSWMEIENLLFFLTVHSVNTHLSKEWIYRLIHEMQVRGEQDPLLIERLYFVSSAILNTLVEKNTLLAIDIMQLLLHPEKLGGCLTIIDKLTDQLDLLPYNYRSVIILNTFRADIDPLLKDKLTKFVEKEANQILNESQLTVAKLGYYHDIFKMVGLYDLKIALLINQLLAELPFSPADYFTAEKITLTNEAIFNAVEIKDPLVIKDWVSCLSKTDSPYLVNLIGAFGYSEDTPSPSNFCKIINTLPNQHEITEITLLGLVKRIASGKEDYSLMHKVVKLYIGIRHHTTNFLNRKQANQETVFSLKIAEIVLFSTHLSKIRKAMIVNPFIHFLVDHAIAFADNPIPHHNEMRLLIIRFLNLYPIESLADHSFCDSFKILNNLYTKIIIHAKKLKINPTDALDYLSTFCNRVDILEIEQLKHLMGFLAQGISKPPPESISMFKGLVIELVKSVKIPTNILNANLPIQIDQVFQNLRIDVVEDFKNQLVWLMAKLNLINELRGILKKDEYTHCRHKILMQFLYCSRNYFYKTRSQTIDVSPVIYLIVDLMINDCKELYDAYAFLDKIESKLNKQKYAWTKTVDIKKILTHFTYKVIKANLETPTNDRISNEIMNLAEKLIYLFPPSINQSFQINNQGVYVSKCLIEDSFKNLLTYLDDIKIFRTQDLMQRYYKIVHYSGIILGRFFIQPGKLLPLFLEIVLKILKNRTLNCTQIGLTKFIAFSKEDKPFLPFQQVEPVVRELIDLGKEFYFFIPNSGLSTILHELCQAPLKNFVGNNKQSHAIYQKIAYSILNASLDILDKIIDDHNTNNYLKNHYLDLALNVAYSLYQDGYFANDYTPYLKFINRMINFAEIVEFSELDNDPSWNISLALTGGISGKLTTLITESPPNLDQLSDGDLLKLQCSQQSLFSHYIYSIGKHKESDPIATSLILSQALCEVIIDHKLQVFSAIDILDYSSYFRPIDNRDFWLNEVHRAFIAYESLIDLCDETAFLWAFLKTLFTSIDRESYLKNVRQFYSKLLIEQNSAYWRRLIEIYYMQFFKNLNENQEKLEAEDRLEIRKILLNFIENGLKNRSLLHNFEMVTLFVKITWISGEPSLVWQAELLSTIIVAEKNKDFKARLTKYVEKIKGKKSEIPDEEFKTLCLKFKELTEWFVPEEADALNTLLHENPTPVSGSTERESSHTHSMLDNTLPADPPESQDSTLYCSQSESDPQ